MSQFLLVCVQESVPLEACTGETQWINILNIETINPLAEFDLEIFGLINGSILVTFLIGHSAGRIVRWLGRS